MKIVFSAALLIASTTGVLAEGAPIGPIPAPAAPAKPTCFERSEIVPVMIRGRASPVFAGRSGGAMLEVWSNGQRWTAYQTTQDGKMCVIAQGHDGAVSAPPTCIDPIRCPRV